MSCLHTCPLVFLKFWKQLWFTIVNSLKGSQWLAIFIRWWLISAQSKWNQSKLHSRWEPVRTDLISTAWQVSTQNTVHSFKFQVSTQNKGTILDCSSGKAHSTLYKPQGILHMSQSWRRGNLIQRRGCHVLKSIGDDEAISCVTTHNITHLRIKHQNITSHMYICCHHTITTIFQHHNLLKSDQIWSDDSVPHQGSSFRLMFSNLKVTLDLVIQARILWLFTAVAINAVK